MFLLSFIGISINTNDEFSEQEAWTIVVEGRSRQACSDRALVLHSIGIPYKILTNDDVQFTLVVPAPVAEKAKFEIWEYERENQSAKSTQRAIAPDYENAFPGVIAYVLVVVLVAWLSGIAAFGQDWVASGRIDGVLIRDGEWWRAFTALTLHGGIKHILRQTPRSRSWS